MIPQEFLHTLAQAYSLSDDELEILSLAVVDGHSLEAIAQELQISAVLVRKRMGNVYRAFRIEGSGPGKLAKLQQRLVELYRNTAHQTQTMVTSAQSQHATLPSSSSLTWDEVPDLSIFYGRESELQQLYQWVVDDQCRIITVLGAAGIGKTSLMTQLIKRVQPKVHHVIWRSLDPPIQLLELVIDLCQHLSPSHPIPTFSELEEALRYLLDLLRQNPHLIILDDLETLLKQGDPLGRFDTAHKSYATFFQRLGETQHESCFLLGTQEHPGVLRILESPAGKIRTYPLSGLAIEDAKDILKERQLGDEDQDHCWEKLIEMHRGHPIELKLVATTIQDLFGGSVADYLASGTIFISNNYLQILHEQFERLSTEEQIIINFLATQDFPVLLSILRQDLNINTATLSDALKSLSWRSWIERTPHPETGAIGFTVQPMLKKYAQQYRRSP